MISKHPSLNVRYPSGTIVNRVVADRIMEQLKTIVHAIDEQVYYLKYRWTGEREYESFDVYSFQVKKLINAQSVAFVKVNKLFTVDLKIDDVLCYIKFQGKGVTWCIK